MSILEQSTLFETIKLYTVNAALYAFLLIGAAKLILEELHSLIPLYRKVKGLLKQNPPEHSDSSGPAPNSS
jgi:hypothetical protein